MLPYRIRQSISHIIPIDNIEEIINKIIPFISEFQIKKLKFRNLLRFCKGKDANFKMILIFCNSRFLQKKALQVFEFL